MLQDLFLLDYLTDVVAIRAYRGLTSPCHRHVAVKVGAVFTGHATTGNGNWQLMKVKKHKWPLGLCIRYAVRTFMTY